MTRLSAGKNSMIALSAIAAGADSLVAEAAMQDRHASLRVVLPLEPDDYRRDFNATDLTRFQSLLNSADAIAFPPAPEKPAPANPPPACRRRDGRSPGRLRTRRFLYRRSLRCPDRHLGRPARPRPRRNRRHRRLRQKIARSIAWIKSKTPYDLSFENVNPV